HAGGGQGEAGGRFAAEFLWAGKGNHGRRHGPIRENGDEADDFVRTTIEGARPMLHESEPHHTRPGLSTVSSNRGHGCICRCHGFRNCDSTRHEKESECATHCDKKSRLIPNRLLIANATVVESGCPVTT